MAHHADEIEESSDELGGEQEEQDQAEEAEEVGSLVVEVATEVVDAAVLNAIDDTATLDDGDEEQQAAGDNTPKAVAAEFLRQCFSLSIEKVLQAVVPSD